jgi:hypothetical protein
MRVGLLAVLGSLLLGAAARAQGEDLLPDVVVDTSRSFVTRIDTDSFPGRTLLRLSSATANVGAGRLEVRASAVISDTHREVVQRIYRSDGSFRERLAGTFTYHPDHGHFHFDEWALFQLRRLAADGTPGEVVAEGDKTSFCLVDFAVHDASNPSFADPPFYTTCDAGFQGITPGWSDLYAFTLPGQWIDATGVPDGVYWLEITADPERRILEADATNNTAGRPVALFPSGIPDDPYEENDSFDAVLAREEAAAESPNLGLVNAPRTLAGLSMSDALDYFRFRVNATGDAGSFVRTDSPHALGDVDLFVVDASRAVVGSSRGRTSREAVSLEGLPAGAYTALVRHESGVVPDYSLRVDPPANGPPAVEWLAPAAGGVFV